MGLTEALMVASILPIGGMLPGGKHEAATEEGLMSEKGGLLGGLDFISGLLSGKMKTRATSKSYDYDPDYSDLAGETSKPSAAGDVVKLATVDPETNRKIMTALVTRFLTDATYSERV